MYLKKLIPFAIVLSLLGLVGCSSADDYDYNENGSKLKNNIINAIDSDGSVDQHIDIKTSNEFNFDNYQNNSIILDSNYGENFIKALEDDFRLIIDQNNGSVDIQKDQNHNPNYDEIHNETNRGIGFEGIYDQ